MEKNLLVFSSMPSKLNHKIKSLWAKHLWFYSNHENISPRKFPAILFIAVCMVEPITIIPLAIIHR